jgi:hypothetical protein
VTRTRHAGWAATLLIATLGLAACAGEGSEDDSLEEVADDESADTATTTTTTTTTEPEETGESTKEQVAAALGGDADGVSDEDAMCVGLAMVDVVGLEVLIDTGALERMDDDSVGSLADLGITLDDSQKAALADGLHECGDLRAMLRDGLAADGSIPPDGAACIVDHLDDATIDTLFVTSIVGGEAALDADPELFDTLAQATVDCVQAGVDVG